MLLRVSFASWVGPRLAEEILGATPREKRFLSYTNAYTLVSTAIYAYPRRDMHGALLQGERKIKLAKKNYM
jgi:hypothetical protein